MPYPVTKHSPRLVFANPRSHILLAYHGVEEFEPYMTTQVSSPVLLAARQPTQTTKIIMQCKSRVSQYFNKPPEKSLVGQKGYDHGTLNCIL
jgi:hypothetical protein